MNAPLSPHKRSDLLAWLLFAGVLALALWSMSGGWHASMIDRHEFRQMQTALSAHWLRENGFQLAYETPLFGPPWSIPLEFPLYQAAVAGLARALDIGIEPAGRAVSLGFFLATLPAVYLLAGLLGLEGRRRLWPVATVTLAPLYLFYGRAVMIETTALCFAVWFLFAVGRAVRDNCVACAAGATVFATLAALAKVTTFVVFAPAAGLIAFHFWWPRWRARDDRAGPWLRPSALAALPVAGALAATVWWLGFADALKAANPFARFLTSEALAPWNWGTLEQRLSGEFWSSLWSNFTYAVFAEPALAVLVAALVCLPAPTVRFAGVAALLFLVGTLLFSNLYFFHDYYYCASAFFPLFAAGVVFARLAERTALPAALRLALPVLFVVAQYAGYLRGYGGYQRRELPAPPALASLLRDAVPPGDVILVYGHDWSSALAYYSQRRAIMIRNGREDDVETLDTILATLPPLRLGALVVANPSLQRSAEFIRTHTDRYGFAPMALASGADGDLYVPEERFGFALRELTGRDYPGVILNIEAARPEEPGLSDHAPAEVALATFQPAPVGARAMHGFVRGEEEGRPALMAHPIAELRFDPPAGARRIEAEFGLFAGAYARDAASITDGVMFEIFELRPGDVRRVLLRRTLDPVAIAADRGPQAIVLDAGPFQGPLVFRTSPGPAGRYNNDWAYWSRIEIR